MKYLQVSLIGIYVIALLWWGGVITFNHFQQVAKRVPISGRLSVIPFCAQQPVPMSVYSDGPPPAYVATCVGMDAPVTLVQLPDRIPYRKTPIRNTDFCTALDEAFKIAMGGKR